MTRLGDTSKIKSVNIVMGLMTICFVIVLICPLYSLFSKAFISADGTFVGLGNYAEYFSTPALSVSIGNTIYISVFTAIVSTLIGFVYAYGVTRTNIKGKQFFRYAALIPLFLPTVVHGLSLVYLFGVQGVVTNLGWDIGLYGKTGIILSEIIYTFPQSFLMFYIALNYADGRLYEAAETMGCGNLKKFRYITVPSVKYTLINSLFVCFTLAFTDFGAPKVVGGSYNVLATDIYKQVAGQFNMNMGGSGRDTAPDTGHRQLRRRQDNVQKGKRGDKLQGQRFKDKRLNAQRRGVLCDMRRCDAVPVYHGGSVVHGSIYEILSI